MTTDELIRYIQLEIVKIGSPKDAAALWGISYLHLCDVRLKKRQPTRRLLQSLGIEKDVRYRLKVAP